MAASHLYKVTHGKGRKQPKRRQKHCNFSHIGASSRFRKTSTGKPRLPFIQIPPALSQPACGFALSCPCVLQFQNMMHFFSLSTTLWKRFNAQCKRRKTKKISEKKDRRYMVFGSRSCSPRHMAWWSEDVWRQGAEPWRNPRGSQWWRSGHAQAWRPRV